LFRVNPKRGLTRCPICWVRLRVHPTSPPSFTESSELLEGGGGAEVVQEESAHDEMGADPDELRGDEVAMMIWDPDPVQVG